MKWISLIAAILVPTAALSFETAPSVDDLTLMSGADVVVIGETHDNPAHHAVQAQIVTALNPAAMVVEMLTPAQVVELEKDKPGYSAKWEKSGWPDFDMYLPVFTASNAAIYGAAVPRDVVRDSYTDGVAAHFDGDVVLFGLDQPLPKDQHDQRIELQFAAHCEALPRESLGGMIEVQRLRDATIAKATLDAIDETGGPVVIITGNGHARSDWGVPSFLQQLRPDLSVITIGQAEDGHPPAGGFDVIYDAPGVDRPDPCDAFK
ncbi:ChaN family lipoprotein [Aliiroseovarius sp. S1339]|uniref:ChaN family lipoprotein n=1 Tax=Aliiroseovarius sp. S1339 TaxID=2936990 RepID=UPI0020BE5D99|nr:ChaN family lipoprotein [Aliiroseovarius sp. S1339]MCK8464226.1 ChaN family lipoprotein [Aliiroseovarius sp. S1339]